MNEWAPILRDVLDRLPIAVSWMAVSFLLGAFMGVLVGAWLILVIWMATL